MFDRQDFIDHDWASTPLGRRENWPRQLHFVCDLILGSKQPMFLLWGPERAFIYNQAYASLWSRTVTTLGRPIVEITPHLWNRLGTQIEDAFEGNSFILSNFSIPGLAEDETRYFDFSYTPVADYDNPGTIIAVMCVCNDVTDMMVSAKEAREHQEILALAIENVTEGVALADRNLNIILWNQHFVSHFGYDPEEVRAGMDARELMLSTVRRGDLGQGDPEPTVASLVQNILSTESGTLEVHRSNGTVLSLYRRSVSGGRFLLVSQDITEAQRTARLKDELVSTVSHELRTPLTAISGALGIVAAGAVGSLSPKAEKLVDIAQRNSERLITLVNDLLDISKLNSGQTEFHLEELDLADIARMSVEQNQPYAERGGVGLQEDLGKTRLVVKADRHRMLQVLANLISNAVKFSPAGEVVIVRLRPEGEMARLSVVDHGAGVAESFRDRLFQRFSQYDSSSSRVQQGTGLGLAICQRIVEKHGGTIWLDTEVVSGATFHVELPLVTEGERR